MNKPNIVETVIVLVSGAVAGSIANQLTDHHVSVATVISAVLTTLATGILLATQIGQALRTTTHTCPRKYCTVSIRTKDVTTTELARLKAYATDHAKHGSTR
ncbi:hypothetical protein ACWC4D_33490 [Streptomyces sp. NPDC001288]